MGWILFQTILSISSTSAVVEGNLSLQSSRFKNTSIFLPRCTSRWYSLKDHTIIHSVCFSMSREFSQGAKCTLPGFGSALWLVYVNSGSFQQTFVGEECVTSQKNVCVGGYLYWCACMHVGSCTTTKPVILLCVIHTGRDHWLCNAGSSSVCRDESVTLFRTRSLVTRNGLLPSWNVEAKICLHKFAFTNVTQKKI